MWYRLNNSPSCTLVLLQTNVRWVFYSKSDPRLFETEGWWIAHSAKSGSDRVQTSRIIVYICTGINSILIRNANLMKSSYRHPQLQTLYWLSLELLNTELIGVSSSYFQKVSFSFIISNRFFEVDEIEWEEWI